MRHRRKINHLSRKSAHRKAMLANMASSLILHKRIHTTVAKAKALRVYVEPLITKAKLSVTTKSSKEEATHLRRVVFSYLQNKEAVTELFREISSKVADRDGGYTRIIKIGNRLGDNAEMCMMELVDYNENLLTEKAAAESKSKRRRRGGKKKDATAETQAAVAEAPVDEVVEDVAEEVVEDVQDEAPVEEVVAETEEKVEAVVEEKVEAPVEEATKEEEKVETPEAKVEETPVEEKKEDSEEDKEKKDKEESK